MPETITPQKNKKSSKKAPQHAAVAKKSHILRNISLCVVFSIIAIAAATVVYANTYAGIYPNTYVEEQNVSGMTENEVIDFLAEIYNSKNLNGITLKISCEGTDVTLPLESLDIKFDNVALTQKVISAGKDKDPLSNTISFVTGIFNKRLVEPVVSYNEYVLLDAFNKAASPHETQPVGHTFSIGKDSVTIYGPVDGLVADREDATKQFNKELAMMTFEDIILTPNPVKPNKLDFDEFYTWLVSDSQNAYYEKIGNTVTVHDSKPKCEVSRETVQKGINDLKNSVDNTVVIPVTVIEPETTSETLKALLYRDELGKYSTNFGGSSAARANNVRLAASRINGTELMPDEEFSYDKTILPRKASNGYMAAAVYVGNKVESGMGGGICQPSSTLYAAALYANLEIVERHNHSLPVGYIPLGMDATIAEGVLDLKLKNNTGYPVKIVATADGGIVSFSILGTNIDNTNVSIDRSSKDRTYYVTRTVKKNGEVVKTEKMRSSTYGVQEKDEN